MSTAAFNFREPTPISYFINQSSVSPAPPDSEVIEQMDYDWYVTRGDISPEVLSLLSVEEKWVTDKTYPDEKYTLYLMRSLYADHKVRWVVTPQICLPDEAIRFEEKVVPGNVIQKVVMDVLKRGGEVYDDLGHIFD
jgi:hypothetical protein